MLDDSTLVGYLLDRRRVLRQLAAVLRRVGPNHPDRAKINMRRRKRRLELRKDLRSLELAIAARCDQLAFTDTLTEETR
jgi:hypothetical protein